MPKIPSPLQRTTGVHNALGSARVGSEYSNGASMKGIDYVVNEKGQVIAVQVDLKQHGAAWDELWDGVVSESRRTEKSIPYAQYRTKRATRKPDPSRTKVHSG